MPDGNQHDNLQRAIAAYQAALTVFSKAADPDHWAATQRRIALPWQKMNDDQVMSVRNAISCAKGAQKVFASAHGKEALETESLLQDLRKTYDSIPAAATQSFESIAPAE
jgi:hypothetical protein